jgi:hypothetical protein
MPQQLLSKPAADLLGTPILWEHIDCLPDTLQAQLLQLFDGCYGAAPPWVIVSSTEPLEHFTSRATFRRPLYDGLDAIHPSGSTSGF